MLTVSWSPPANNGGDVITAYRVEWDTSPVFKGLIPLPNKGFKDLDAATYSSYTIEYLTPGLAYYVRVYAQNSAGLGTPSVSQPGRAAPALEVAGKPHSITAVPGLTPGTISLTWQYPRIPWHNIPCSGTPALPMDCPAPVGGGLPSSTGGSAITEYQISYSELADFSNYEDTKTTPKLFYSLTGLTPGRLYYIRVLARNAQGAGQYCAYADNNCLIVTTQVSSNAAANIV